MKLGKLSLVAVMALGTSAFAIDNIKTNGQAKLIYQTADFEGVTDTGLFDKGAIGQAPAGASYGGAAAGGASLTLGATANLADNISAGAELQAFSTLGLENNLVSSTMIGGTDAGNTGGIKDSWAMSQAYIAATVGKTTVKIGRQELDTPLAFTEKWNILKNTFDAAVVLNNDLPDTTLVVAWVGKDNGQQNLGNGKNYGGNGRTASLYASNTDDSSAFDNFAVKGAYALAAVNKSIPDTTIQAWYYNVLDVADAIWLQADTKMMGVNLGAQYSTLDTKGVAAALKDSAIWAVKGSTDLAGMNIYAAYSQADKDADVGFANVATGDKTKIYTGDGSIYMDGIVTAPGAKAFKVGASTKMASVALSASYASASDVVVAGADISAWDVSASTKAGPVGLTAIYTDVSNDSTQYGGRDNSTLRIIAALPF